MRSQDFVVVPAAGTVGDALRALADAKGDANWHIVVRYADHYGAIQAGKLAQAVGHQSVQAALDTLLQDISTPVTNVVAQGELDDTARVRQVTLVLEDDHPSALVYESVRGSPLDYMSAKSAFDQLTSAALASIQSTPGAAIPTSDYIIVPETATVGDALRVLMMSKGDPNWYVIVRFQDHYGAIQAGPMVQAVIGRGEYTALRVPLHELSILPINALPRDKLSAPDQIRELTLVLENNVPVLVHQPYIAPQSHARAPFDQLTGVLKLVNRHVPSVPVYAPGPESILPELAASPAPASELEVADARARYVNTWFTDRLAGEAFLPERSLARNRRYFVQLHIGPLLRASIIVGPRPIDPDLMPIPDEGLVLHVKLFSRDFEIENDTALLRLFRAGATERLFFAVTAPEATGEARLRAGIYYQNNLVQSVLLHARVDEQEMKRGYGDYANWAEVEYSLSEDWADITQLRPRRVSIFVNDSPDGTHTVGVVGTQTEGTLNVGRDKMAKAATDFRDKLRGIIMDDQKRYRYGPDNSGDQDKFSDDLKTLAYVGNALFRSVFYRSETIDFTRELSQTLASSQTAVIQIASLASDFVFPWAGIYDRRLEIDRSKNQVCLEPLKHETPEAALSACGSCSHDQDRNVICLSGFWGFRHIVEQPLGIVKNDKKPTSIVREIKASGKLKTSVNVYMGNDLKLRDEHQTWIRDQLKLKNGEPILADELSEVKVGLRQPQQLCYFYCHGGSDSKSLNPWLTVGKDERFMPSDLYALGLEEDWRFSNVRPLVFINACHSIEFTPEALSAFLPEFTTAGASGIIGTEVSIFEPLAVEFGQGLIQAFLDGEPIGRVVQRLRWQLLLKRNVLGLVYTPYCYADLRLVA